MEGEGQGPFVASFPTSITDQLYCRSTANDLAGEIQKSSYMIQPLEQHHPKDTTCTRTVQSRPKCENGHGELLSVGTEG